MYKIRKTSLILTVFIILILSGTPAWAVRPFITDDATIIGSGRSEVANWFYGMDGRLEIWHSINYGITDNFEFTLAGSHGGLKSEVNGEWKYAYTLPLLQSKVQIRDYEPNGIPALAFGIGSQLPFGNEPFENQSAFKPSGYGAFGFVSITQCIGENEELLIHGSLGGTYLRDSGENKNGLTWGVGTQFKMYKGLHGIAEFVGGDPYTGNSTSRIYQLGIRYFISDDFQFDLAYGNGSETDYWISGGIRWVIDFSKSKKNKFAPNGRKIS